jgi:AcrR family transcriptional regulator
MTRRPVSWLDSAMDRHLPTRRERLRVEMAGDIVAAARELLSADGVNAVSLRATARRIGVSPAAIYRYFPSLNALIGALHDDVLDELRGAIACARDRSSDDSSVTRLRSMVQAFRGWALQHPAEFRFSLGPADRILTLTNIFLAEFSRSLQHHEANTTFLSAWIKIYGLVALENSGDLSWMKDTIEIIFDDALAEFAEQLPGEYSWTCR